MTIVKGIIADSSGTPLSGNLIVTLAGAVFNKATTPNTVYIPEPKTFTITNGVVNINLPESETSKVSYKFEFFVTAGGVTSTNQAAPFPFNAVVPNIAEVELDDLAPTGMVSDVLDTGVLRIARLLASDPSYAAALSGISPKGNWASNIFYKNGDLVTYNSRLYICRSLSPISGIIPFDGSTVWMVIPTSTTGVVTLGSNTPYGSSWSSSDLAAAQSTLFNVLETKANLASPTFTGNVNVPTVATSDSSTLVASTAHVKNNLTLYAPLASPQLTGAPTAPTAANGTNTTQVATTGFAQQLNRPAWNVFANAGQTQSTDFYTIIFNGENLDSNNAYSGGFFICPTGFSGSYLIGGGVYFVNLDSNLRTLGVELHVNGAAYRRLTEVNLSPGVGIHCTLSTALLYLSAGQNCSLVVRTFGSTFNYRVAVTSTTWWGYRLAV